MDGFRAIITLGYHLHLHLRGLDRIAESEHLTELTVTAELRITRDEDVAQITRSRDVTRHIAHRGRETLDLLDGVGQEHSLEVIAVVQSLTHTGCDGVDILHDRTILQADDIVGKGSVDVWRLKQFGPQLRVLPVLATDSEVREALQSNLLRVTRTGDDA